MNIRIVISGHKCILNLINTICQSCSSGIKFIIAPQRVFRPGGREDPQLGTEGGVPRKTVYHTNCCASMEGIL